MLSFTPKEKKYFEIRDCILSGLKVCKSANCSDIILSSGYILAEEHSLVEGNAEYNLSIYKKSKHTVAIYNVYIEKEGGLNYETIYSSDGKLL